MKIQSIIPISLLLTVSACSESPDIEQEASGIPQTLVAEIADDFTRTAFLPDADGNENSRFTWLTGDRMKMLLTDNTFATYESTADGRSAQFRLVDTDKHVTANVNMGKFSFYPTSSARLMDGKPVVYLKGDILDISDLQLNNVPIIANNFMRGYTMYEPYLWFHVAMAVMKVDIENIPDNELIWADITHPDYPLCGFFSVADDAHIYESERIDMDCRPDYRMVLPAGNVSLFIPVPLGEMPAGLKVSVFKASDLKSLATATTNKAIKFEAGKGYDLGTVRCHDIDTQTTVEWNGKTVTIEMAEGTTAVEVAWIRFLTYNNCSLYEESTYNNIWVPNRTRFETSGTYPFNLPPAEEALNGQGLGRMFDLVYRTIGEDGFDYYQIAWEGSIPDELYDDVDLSWSKINVGFGS